ncbi:hypothetical protein WMF27_45650 [Sorangium sp. So ce281]|uniref:hypothetical protein n=1 Tax=Sorangium sp. So ce281 TaxID=3133293 RepID=UPI003F63BB6A
MLTIQNTESMIETQTTDVVDTKAGVQRLELTLKKISEKSNETLQAVPLSSACTSGCFSSVSSISVSASSSFDSLDEGQLESVIRMHDKAIDVMGQDALVSAAIAKGVELGADKK